MTAQFNLRVEQILQHQKNNLVVIFPGRFQPFHLGHKKIYDLARQSFPGADFFIATADTPPKVAQPERYPFNFAEKKQIMLAAGIHEKEIRLTTQPYKPIEILKDYDMTVTKVIYLVGKKDMDEDPRFTFGVTKSGKPSYFQPFKDLAAMQPSDEKTGHGYVYAPATVEFNLGNMRIKSSTELRNLYRNAADEDRKKIIAGMLGKFSEAVFNIFNNKIK